MSALLNDYDYSLPAALIAKRPLSRRDASKMMVLHRQSETIEHRMFGELGQFLRSGDLLVLNDTRVLPARRFSDDGMIEFLFLEKIAPKRWKCLIKPGRKMRIGATTIVEGVSVCVDEILSGGERAVSFSEEIDPYAGGSMPLPPYIGRPSDCDDETRYQTVFAHMPGALAAPTAGLHFTDTVLQAIPHTFVTLHVGTGTFRPVHSETISEHHMQAEKFTISREAAEKINRADRIIAVGTTTVRTLESVARQLDRLKRSSLSQPAARRQDDVVATRCLKAVKCEKAKIEESTGETDIFIYPPFQFQIVGGLLTNFHLPKSTLLMLVSAFAGREFILRAYSEAIRERYRFYSYGDCMLII